MWRSGLLVKIDLDWFVLKWWTTAPKPCSVLVSNFLFSQSRKFTFHKKGGTIIKLYVYQVLFVKVQFIKITYMYIVLNKNWYMILVTSLLQFVSLYPYFHLRYSTVWLFPRKQSLREKYPNAELFLVRIFLYSVRIRENTDQK